MCLVSGNDPAYSWRRMTAEAAEMGECDSLFEIAARILLPAEIRTARAFRDRLPPVLCNIVEALALGFRRNFSIAFDLVDAQQLMKVLRLCPRTRNILVTETVLRLEGLMDPSDFFELCSRFCMDEATARLYDMMSDEQYTALLNRHSLVQCRARELRNADTAKWLRKFREQHNLQMVTVEGSVEEWMEARRYSLENNAYICYERVALDCAKSGYFDAFERSLGKIEPLGDVILPRCVLEAIRHGQYHIANRIACCDNYEKAFYIVFPDGRVPAKFFATLLEADLVKEGERIALALLNYLPRFDVQRLRRTMEDDKCIAHSGILRKFDTMYSEVLDQRDYPYDAEW